MRYQPSPTIEQLYFAESSALSAIEQEAQEQLFFSRLRLSNGVFKTTAYRRMDDVNQCVAPLLARDRQLELMDVAISSGVPTIEWMRQLDEQGIGYRMTAGDLTIEAVFYSLGSFFQALTEKNGHPLQFDLFRMSFPNASGSRFRNAAFRLMRLFFGPLRSMSRQTDSLRASRGRLRAGILQSPFTLVSPELAAQDDALTLIEDDVLTNRDPGLLRRFDAIRAANILQPSYFDDDTIRMQVRNLAQRLVPGGLLIVCRTDQEGCNNGTVFRHSEDGDWESVERIGGGSEIERLIL